ncbi:MAG: hypothetical protein M8865_02295 [marine benthic group bacterium]|nr:hypothetical protein [Gemmatimonadota bacterium]
MRRSGATILALLLTGGCAGSELVVDGNPRPDTIGRTVQVAPTSTHSNGEKVGKPGKSSAATLGIPPGHLPDPGSCRVWLPGEAPGLQKDLAAGDCSWVATQVPAGGWLVWRPTRNHKEVVVREYGSDSSMLWTRIYDAATGVLLHEDARGE